MGSYGLEVPQDCFASTVSSSTRFTRPSAINSFRRTSSPCSLRGQADYGSDTRLGASASLTMERSLTTAARPHLRPELCGISLRARTEWCGLRQPLVSGDSTVLTGSTSDQKQAYRPVRS